jgi:vancomycin resistance protein VanJ
LTDLGPRRYRIADYAVRPSAAAPRERIRLASRTIADVACVCYGALVVGAWICVRWSPPEFWPVSLVLYGPRWIAGLPLLVMAPVAAWFQLRRSAVALAIALAGFILIWGFNVPWKTFLPEIGGPGRVLRVLTCNVQHRDLRIDDLKAVIREVRPDLVLLQEWSIDDPRVIFGDEGWDVRSASELCLASRYPIESFESLVRPDKAYRTVAVRASVRWNGQNVPIVNVHLITPRKGLEAIIASPLRGIGAFRAISGVQQFESELVRRWINNSPGSILLAGDFNLTVEHPLYRQHWSDFQDAFSLTSWGLGNTMFTERIGLRIDHILCGQDWQPKRCWVGPDVGSAHRPVIADVSMNLSSRPDSTVGR